MDYRPCHCLCGIAHPAEPGICDAENAVTVRTLWTPRMGFVQVPLCARCAATQDRLPPGGPAVYLMPDVLEDLFQVRRNPRFGLFA